MQVMTLFGENEQYNPASKNQGSPWGSISLQLQAVNPSGKTAGDTVLLIYPTPWMEICRCQR